MIKVSIEENYYIKFKSIIILGIFLISSFIYVTPLIMNSNNQSLAPMHESLTQKVPLENKRDINRLDSTSNLRNSLDTALFDWVSTGLDLDSNIYRKNINSNPMISVFAHTSTNLDLINENMEIDSFLDLGGFGYIILGSVSTPDKLLKMTQSNPFIKISSDPYREYSADFQIQNPDTISDGNTPFQFIGNEEMFVNQAHAMDCGGLSCNGTGITVAIVDGGTDFGSSDLEPALALDSQGFPKSFDTEGWSLVSTPLTVGIDIPISSDNSTLIFNNIDDETLNKLQINDPGDVESNGRPILDTSKGWKFWHEDSSFMKPQDWKINPSWINQSNQALPKFGVGVQHWQDMYTDKLYWGYFYALILDINADNKYESAIIDMETSAWASYLKYIASGGHEIPMSYILPDFDFTNDKVVSWLSNSERGRNAEGKDYTFAKDWNGDGANDWSFGSLANAYNRFGFLSINQSLYGKIIKGVDPDGAGFVTYYPFAHGFSAHGTWTASNTASRGVVDYYLFTNRTNSWNYPYGNSSTRKLPGTAPGADLMSVSFGAAPQDELLAWFWAAGFDLDTTLSSNTVAITGAQWKWSGNLRANITSNSWGLGGLYWGGFWGTDWLGDLLSLANLGGGTSFIRNIEDVWSSKVMGGTSTETNLRDINYFSTFTPFTNISTGNTLYIGGNNPYVGIGVNISIPSLTNLNIVPQYYTGSQWKTITPTENIVTNSLGVSWIRFSSPNDWQLAKFPTAGEKYYWSRIIVTENSQVEISDLFIDYINPYYGFPGLLMVTSAGNDYYYQSTGSPIGSLTLKVGASSSAHVYANQHGPNWNQTNYQMAYFSSAGPKSNGVPVTDVVAPGFFVYSAAPLSRSIMGGDRSSGDILEFGGNGNYSFIRWAGTSASAPAAAGVAAIAYQAYAAANPGITINPNKIKQIIKSTASNLFYPSNIQGTGIINASAIVEYIQNPDSSNYFLIGSNKTYEDQLKISSWLSNLDAYFWYYSASTREELSNLVDFPAFKESLLSNPHYDVDLSTNSITKGEIVNTQAVIENNGTGNIAVNSQHAVVSEIISKTIVIDGNDQFLGMTGDYQVNISIADLDVWDSDYIEIKVKNLEDFDNVSLFVWQDFDGDGYVEMANYTLPETNGAGELARVQYDSTNENRTYGILKVGNPARFNTTNQVPILVFRGNSQTVDVHDPNWASGKLLEISIKKYSLDSDWSSVVSVTPWKTENNVTYFNVSLNTTNLQAGFHLGYLNFTDQTTGHTQLMPVSLKVEYGQIDQSDSKTNPDAIPTQIGNYSIPHYGTPFENGFRSGSMIWVPFSVNESKTSGKEVLAIRLTQLSPGDANVGFVLHYDETPNSFDSNWVQILVSPNNTGQYQGKNVNWQYIQWDNVGFGSDTFVSRFGYIRFGVQADPPIIKYKIGLFTTDADDEVDVKLEMYWLPQMPVLEAVGTSDSTIQSYCQVSSNNLCYYGTTTFYGPNANLNITASCTSCDPNLPAPTVLFNKIESETNLTTGSFEFGFNPDISVDWWEKRKFQKGDLIEFTVVPSEPITDFNLWLFSPDTLDLMNKTELSVLPMNDTGAIFSSDFLFKYATTYIGEFGSFIAESTGEYWFGIDNYGTQDTDWFVFTRVSRGEIKDFKTTSIEFNTMTDSEFGLEEEATYDAFTSTYDKVTHMVIGANSPTSLNTGLVSFDANFDNYVAPFVQLGDLSLALNNSKVEKSQGSITFDWEGYDLNGNSGNFFILFDGPHPEDLYFDIPQSNTYTWDFSEDPTEFSEGWWTILIYADDSQDPLNTINGKNYGGIGIPAEFSIFLHTSNFSQVTTTETVNLTQGPSLLELLGFTTIGVFIGVAAISIGALAYLRRLEIRTKYNDVRTKLKEQINERRTKKE